MRHRVRRQDHLDRRREPTGSTAGSATGPTVRSTAGPTGPPGRRRVHRRVRHREHHPVRARPTVNEAARAEDVAATASMGRPGPAAGSTGIRSTVPSGSSVTCSKGDSLTQASLYSRSGRASKAPAGVIVDRQNTTPPRSESSLGNAHPARRTAKSARNSFSADANNCRELDDLPIARTRGDSAGYHEHASSAVVVSATNSGAGCQRADSPRRSPRSSIAIATRSLPALLPELESAARRLQQPLRIAVIGRVKAGKSTLVNALLGQRVAPTDVSECTRLVTWFHYGHPQRLEVHLRDGRRAERPLADDGLLPAELGFPLAEIAELHVFLANAALQSFTLIDTPGLGSVHPDYSASTEELLAVSRSTKDAAGRADAVVYLMNQVILEDELKALVGVGGAAARMAARACQPMPCARSDCSAGSTSSATVAVIRGRSAWSLAAHYAELLRDQVSSVIPVMGLLAETTESALLTEQDAQALATLARLPSPELTKLTWTADRFRSADAPVGRPERQRLIDLLALHGVRSAIGLVQREILGAAALRRALGEASGIAAVKQALALLAAERDLVLKTRSALQHARSHQL